MADSIRELIMKDLETTMALINGTGPYTRNIASIQRFEQDGNSFDAQDTIVLAGGDESEEYGPDPLKSITLNVELDLWTRHDKAADAFSTDELLNQYISDIKRAVMVDHTRGGNAQQTDITGSIPFETSEGAYFVGIMFQIEIKYRHNVFNTESQL